MLITRKQMTELNRSYYEKFCDYLATMVGEKNVDGLPTEAQELYLWCDKRIQCIKKYNVTLDQDLIAFVLLCTEYKDVQPVTMSKQVRGILENINVPSSEKISMLQKYLTHHGK